MRSQTSARTMAAFVFALLVLVLVRPAYSQNNTNQNSANAKQLLAPTGKLRAAFLGGNPALGKVDPTTGAVSGPVADFVADLAHRLNVDYELLPVRGGGGIDGALNSHSADIGFLAYNAGRAQQMDFSRPWLMMSNTYLVLQNSPIRRVEDADSSGMVIAASNNQTQHVYLRSHLKNAKVVPLAEMPPYDEIQAGLEAGKWSAFAVNTQRLLDIQADFPKMRIVEGDFFPAPQSVAMEKGDPARIAALNRLIDEILRAGVVKQAIERAKLGGVYAAPLDAKN